MAAYYNEFDPKAAAWLRELIKRDLIAPGDVDERSIKDVQPDDLKGYTQCHFFAGVGGWPLALRLAGVSDASRVWTGSPPCQPFSKASRGKRKGVDCERHLWPEMRRLISKCQPCIVFGEQVLDGSWVDAFCDEMEGLGYTIRAEILPAYSAAKDHARERFYFACYANSYSEPVRAIHEQVALLSWGESHAENVVLPHGFSSRVAYRGFGNAIVPAVAAEFIQASIDAIEEVAG